MTRVCWIEQRWRDVPAGVAWLGRNELARLASLRFPRRRQDWLLGRWTAKQAVIAYLRLSGAVADLADIEIRASSGAPEPFLAGERAQISISLSHRAGIGLCSIAPAGTVLGCDVEMIEPREASFAENYFTPDELELICHAGETSRNRLITLLWSTKESVLKALGVGLRRPTTDVRVHLGRSGAVGIWEPVCAHTADGRIFHGWYREADALLRTVAVAAPSGLCLFQA